MKLVVAAWWFWLLSSSAAALEFDRLVPERSRVDLVSTQMGAEVVGGFRAFRADLAFDPARPTRARVRIEIDLASLDAGSKEGNEAAKGADWLNVAAFPRASFESTSVRALGRGRYEALGRLTLRGREREVKIRFGFRQVEALGVFEGRFDLRRLDYGIGEAVWGDTGVVADVVRIRFRLVAEGSSRRPSRSETRDLALFVAVVSAGNSRTTPYRHARAWRVQSRSRQGGWRWNRKPNTNGCNNWSGTGRTRPKRR